MFLHVDNGIVDLQERVRRAALPPPIPLGGKLTFHLKASQAWGSLKDTTARRLLLALPPCINLLARLCEKTESRAVSDFSWNLSVVLEDLLLDCRCLAVGAERSSFRQL